MPESYDVIIIGGGHAGAEAAWAAARLGASVALITLDPTRIAQMSCNPAIGGLAKGQMVREIDALGGLMGIAIDNTGIQFRMLNRSKGAAVWGPRAQADKYRYAAEVQRLLKEFCPSLDIITGEVTDIETTPGGAAQPDAGADGGPIAEDAAHGSHIRATVRGVRLADGTQLRCRAVVVTTGTFLRALMHTGEQKTEGGRVGEAAAKGLSGCLARLGLELGRLKTGTPPRLKRDTIDFSKFDLQPGDDEPLPFSYLHENGQWTAGSGQPPLADGPSSVGGSKWSPPLPQIPCYLGATNSAIHEIIRANLHRAPMYSGQIQSTGPRYCPSLEDKIVRFADKASHHIFLEPEGLDTDEIYCNGLSTSLPADVQEQMIRLIPGLERAEILRYGYAVEYDMVWPTQIRATLETKTIAGLFLAGQINGTSGYEEAAGQGLIAGVNATRYALTERSQSPLILRRDQAYIGVMIDDLVTKPPTEPYRMFTSRAEHRLHLRSDNADIRLTPLGREIGLVDDARWACYTATADAMAAAVSMLKRMRMSEQSAYDYLRRSDADWNRLVEKLPELASIPPAIGRRIEIAARYEGYIRRQDAQIARFSQLESKLIPAGLDYNAVPGLRNEAKQKFRQFTPASLGQALRISGITPADVTVLAIYLAKSPVTTARATETTPT